MQVSDFQTISYDSVKQIMFIHVNEKTAFATTELVKEAQYATVEALQQYKPQYIITNVVDLRFAITPELQEWINEEIIPHLFGSGVKKIAYIMPTEFIEKLYMEQLYDGAATKIHQAEPETQMNYFDNEPAALRWFTQKTTNLNRFASWLYKPD
jgi:hypothetical protein